MYLIMDSRNMMTRCFHPPAKISLCLVKSKHFNFIDTIELKSHEIEVKLSKQYGIPIIGANGT